MSATGHTLRFPFFSGEFFDLSIPSTNDKFGALHNLGMSVYGINFPLSKFIEEMREIIKGGNDDKTSKRKQRLNFLEYCNTCVQLQEFFESLCNYLNGKDGTGTQHEAYIVVTAAGGNIIIVFAQLIMNIIDSYRTGVAGATEDVKVSALAFFTPPVLMPTNQILLTILTKFSGIDILDIARLIVEHFVSDSANYEALKNIANSEASDCDFKLSPNKYNLDVKIALSQITRQIGELELDDDAYKQAILSIRGSEPCDSSHPIKAGFLLVRIKSLIDCHSSHTQQHTRAELKSFKNACRPFDKYKNLYPQIFTEQILQDARNENVHANCIKYLEHLSEKKKTIKDMTQMIIDEAAAYELSGVSKQSNADGSITVTLPPATDKTEAIIRYIRRITEKMNAYIIQKWQLPLLRAGLTYKLVWSNFESLNKIIHCHANLIPYLASKIAEHFLNDPEFYSEDILDNLIERFNKKYGSNCAMIPAEVVLVPSPEYSDLCYYPLVPIKDSLEDVMYSKPGFPDGVRITINALVSAEEQKINIREIDFEALRKLNEPEAKSIIIQEKEQEQKQKEQKEKREQERVKANRFETEARRDGTPKVEDRERERERESESYNDDSDYSDDGNHRMMVRGGYNRGKKKFTLKNKKMVKNIKVVKKTQEKLKTKPKKTRRQKNLRKVTLKHKKSRKHKSIKHKYRKHKL